MGRAPSRSAAGQLALQQIAQRPHPALSTLAAARGAGGRGAAFVVDALLAAREAERDAALVRLEREHGDLEGVARLHRIARVAQGPLRAELADVTEALDA